MKVHESIKGTDNVMKKTAQWPVSSSSDVKIADIH